jgi:hypothetical protein
VYCFPRESHGSGEEFGSLYELLWYKAVKLRVFIDNGHMGPSAWHLPELQERERYFV